MHCMSDLCGNCARCWERCTCHAEGAFAGGAPRLELEVEPGLRGMLFARARSFRWDKNELGRFFSMTGRHGRVFGGALFRIK